jgi:hypothetical protein
LGRYQYCVYAGRKASSSNCNESKMKTSTQLANVALKLHIKNTPSDKHFQGKQTKQKLKNLCGV